MRNAAFVLLVLYAVGALSLAGSYVYTNWEQNRPVGLLIAKGLRFGSEWPIGFYDVLSEQ